jgi:arginyl-tRNA synthetase
MTHIDQLLTETSIKALSFLYQEDFLPASISIQATRKEFKGDSTLVVFPFLKASKKSPEQTAAEIGKYLQENLSEISGFNVVKGFLNLEITDEYWTNALLKNKKVSPSHVKKLPVMVEYSSPNTNKPLHLGHIRNNLLGFSLAEILKANGDDVIKANLINDRGIHICKSMLAWQKWGAGETPETSNTKGDHLVGKYYVLFDKEYKKEIAALVENGHSEEVAKKDAPLINEAQAMLLKWEQGDKETLDLWKKMNSWVYAGFHETYKNLGVDFDKFYYESETYLSGKTIVEEGLSKGVFYKKEDDSVWVDLTPDGLDHKLLLRGDGTSVYITQDLGTAHLRHKEFGLEKLIYVVGNEQDYHFKVLQLILKKLGWSWADGIFHLSYGMVDLPSGKMKSREGTVVDADDLMEQMVASAKALTMALGKTDGYTLEAADELYKTIAMGALKYFILKVDPKKRMLFNPEESIDFNGNTGPFIQYTYARICSVLKKAQQNKDFLGSPEISRVNLLDKEKEIIKTVYSYQSVIQEAAQAYSPALIANYVYELAKQYNQFYHEVPILTDENTNTVQFRIALSEKVGHTLKNALGLLGIHAPERM